MINSQREVAAYTYEDSISKGMGDQFSALIQAVRVGAQYIKGDG